MDSVIFKKMECLPKPINGGNYESLPIFGFAVDEYIVKYGVSLDDIKDFYIFGAVLNSGDINDDFFELMSNIIMQGGNNVCMLVFDTNNLTVTEEASLKRLEGHHGFEEIEDCYEDRIVFARE